MTVLIPAYSHLHGQWSVHSASVQKSASPLLKQLSPQLPHWSPWNCSLSIGLGSRKFTLKLLKIVKQEKFCCSFLHYLENYNSKDFSLLSCFSRQRVCVANGWVLYSHLKNFLNNPRRSWFLWLPSFSLVLETTRWQEHIMFHKNMHPQRNKMLLIPY